MPTVFTVRGETVIVESEQLTAAGEPEAVNTVIQTYTGYIKYLLSREYQRRYSRLFESVLNGSTTQVPL